MGDKLNSFLKELSDHELAIFGAFQYDGLLPDSRKNLQAEIDSRSLTKIQLEKYISTKLETNYLENTCERCGSNKFIQDVDIEHSGGNYGSAEVEVTTNRCRICGYNPSKALEKNVFKRIKRFFIDPNKTSEVVTSYYWLDSKPHKHDNH